MDVFVMSVYMLYTYISWASIWRLKFVNVMFAVDQSGDNRAAVRLQATLYVASQTNN